jgi:hypothetical protein
MEVNFDDEVNEVSAKIRFDSPRPVVTGELAGCLESGARPKGLSGAVSSDVMPTKQLFERIEETLELTRQHKVDLDEDGLRYRERVLVTGNFALQDLVRLLPEVPMRTRARILETLAKLAVVESKQITEKHTHVHMEKHEHLHWEGSQLQEAAKTAEEQDRLRKRTVEG